MTDWYSDPLAAADPATMGTQDVYNAFQASGYAGLTGAPTLNDFMEELYYNQSAPQTFVNWYNTTYGGGSPPAPSVQSQTSGTTAQVATQASTPTTSAA